MTRVAIVSYARTPIGSFLGSLASMPAAKLGAHAIKSAVERAGIDPKAVEAAYVGNVLQAGQGQAPGRQAVIHAGLDEHTRTVTMNKVCGSGLQAVISGAREILLGEASVVVAAGMESMTNAPFVLPNMRLGQRMGDAKVVDSMIYDGLWDPYDDVHMGACGELCANKYSFSREDQDAFAVESVKRAQEATEKGLFADEIAPIEIPQRKGDPVVVDTDEGVGKARPEKISGLRPAFDKEGTITAANASSINDGASAIVLMSEEKAKELGVDVIAYVDSWAAHAVEPKWFTIAPVGAMEANLKKAGKSVGEIDLFEVNEAFAVVTMAAMKELELPADKTNVRGGAVVLGHPIGCSGNRILVTLLSSLKERGQKWGQAGICIGGGEGLSMIVEMA